MTDPQVGMLMLGLFIFIIMLGFPIAFTLMAMGVGFGYYAYFTPGQDIVQNRIFTLLVQKAFEVCSSDAWSRSRSSVVSRSRSRSPTSSVTSTIIPAR